MDHPLIDVQVVTPYGRFLDTKCELITLPTSEGQLGVMAGHMPFIAAIYPGELKISTNESSRSAFVSAGYVEVRRKQVIVITNAAEWAEDIDEERALRALERAAGRLHDKELAEDLIRRNQHAIRRAKRRLYVAKMHAEEKTIFQAEREKPDKNGSRTEK
ncbi:MAG: ATP synthase F1 subunit epsilon [Clostridia bacterium]|nr:ATP synthase F1 subunit epsilon [Clostridia bacterium]